MYSIMHGQFMDSTTVYSMISLDLQFQSCTRKCTGAFCTCISCAQYMQSILDHALMPNTQTQCIGKYSWRLKKKAGTGYENLEAASKRFIWQVEFSCIFSLNYCM